MKPWRHVVPLGVIAVLGATVLCVVALPAWLVPAGGLSAPDRLSAENDVRTTLLQALGGLLALGGVAIDAVLTLRQLRANREGHLIGLFTKAIEQLASEDVSVRHGGVYALELLPASTPPIRGTHTRCSRRSSASTRRGHRFAPSTTWQPSVLATTAAPPTTSARRSRFSSAAR